MSQNPRLPSPAIRFASALVAWFATCCLCLSAVAAPKWVRVTVPGSQAATSMTIAWNDTSGGVGEVEYGLAGAALKSKAKATSFKGKGTIGTVFEANVSGLEADTKYDYRVGGASAWSKTYHFRTAPVDGCTGFNFIAGGDHRSDDNAGPNPKWKAIIEDMKDNSPRFILESGDLVRSGKDEKQWIAHMNMAEALLPWFPMMPAIGNHDADSAKGANAYYNQIFALPTNNISKTEDYWSFTYGNVLILSLSTQTFGDDGFVNQAKWMDETLTKHKDKTWKIAFYHHPSYTSYADLKIADLNHPPNEKGQNKAFIPVFDKHGVDLVFAGHNHFYERFKPMKGGKPVGAGQGTVFVTSGGTGAFTYDVIDIGILKFEPMKIICGKGVLGIGGGLAEGSVKCSGKNHFVLVEVDGNTLVAKVLATSAQNAGTSPKNKAQIDTFTLTKPGTPNCKPVPPQPDAGGMDAGAADAGGAVDAGSTQDAGQAPVDTGPSTPDAVQAVDSGADLGPGTDVGAAADAGATAGADSQAGDKDQGGGLPPVDGAGNSAPIDGIAGQPGGGTSGATSQPTNASSSGCTSAPASNGAAGFLFVLLLAGHAAVIRRRQSGTNVN